MIQDITSSAQAICTDDLRNEYLGNSKSHLFFSFIVLVPIAFMIVLAVFIRSVHRHMHTELTKSPDHHPVLVGFTLTGSYLLLFIFAMDVAAIHCYITGCYKITDLHVDNIRILFATFVLDAIITLQCLIFMLYLLGRGVLSDFMCTCEKCCQCTFSWCIVPYFYAIFGSKRQDEIWKVDTPDDNKTHVWVVTGILAAPLFALSSHAGYILLAWVTEPAKTTATFLIALGCLVFLFFKESYMIYVSTDKDGGLFKINRNKKCENCCTICEKLWMLWFPFVPLLTILSHLYNMCCLCGLHVTKYIQERRHHEEHNVTNSEQIQDNISYKPRQ